MVSRVEVFKNALDRSRGLRRGEDYCPAASHQAIQQHACGIGSKHLHEQSRPHLLGLRCRVTAEKHDIFSNINLEVSLMVVGEVEVARTAEKKDENG